MMGHHRRLCLLLAGALAACQKPAPPPRARVVPVRAAAAASRTVPLEVTAIGTVTPIATVEVKSLVAGEIQRVYFKEGQYVKKGDPLFRIDPRPFELAAHQAEAALVRDQAQYKNARAEADRYAKLIGKGMVSHEEFEQRGSAADALEATVKADEAALNQAQVNLAYCYITSPIDGKTGSLLVTAGNVVKANDISLVSIRQISPIYVAFSVPADRLPEIRQAQAAGKPLKVTATVSGPAGATLDGQLTFVDNTIDVATGTVALKATFANQDRTLWPGQFVNATLVLRDLPNAVVIPARAVETGQSGNFVFVVGPDRKVESRPVQLGERLTDIVVVESGVRPGEQVVTDGQLSLIAGAAVQVLPSEPAGRASTGATSAPDGGRTLD